jgi:hypothetical protein
MSDQRDDDVLATEPGATVGARNEARLLALLESDETGGLTVEALREHGIRAPGQAVYTLQLAGHQIDRVSREGSDGHMRLGYRLHASSAAAPGRSNGS